MTETLGNAEDIVEVKNKLDVEDRVEVEDKVEVEVEVEDNVEVEIEDNVEVEGKVEVADNVENKLENIVDRAMVRAKHSDCLDLVCSQYVLAEKEHANRNSIYERSARLISYVGKAIGGTILVYIGVCIFFTGLGEILSLLTGNVGSYDAGFAFVIVLFLIQTLLLILFAIFRYGQKPFPTNIIVAPPGIRFAWRQKGNSQSELIPWDIVTGIHAYSRCEDAGKPGDSDIIIRLDIDTTLISIPQTLQIWKQTRALSRGIRTAHHPKKLHVNFPLDSLNLDADKFRLLSAIREMAPQTALAPDFDDIFKSKHAPTYTELWLDDMQTFRRQSAHELPTGSPVNDGRYKVIDKIATGGQAKIYKALDTRTDTLVALKELVLPVNAGAEVRNRSFANVKKEALLLAHLNHSGILKLLDNFVEDHRAYLVFEYIDGRTLRNIVQNDGPIDENKVISAAIDICDILAYLHSQSPPVVHRDIAPDNLMIAADGKILLLDFNFAQQLESNATRTVVGKHNYMAPEQFKGKPCPQSDLYSLGGTLSFLLTGDDPTPISCSRPGALRPVDPALDNIVAQLTAPDLASRYKSAGDAAADLVAMQQQGSNLTP